jgi:hypothetical protein
VPDYFGDSIIIYYQIAVFQDFPLRVHANDGGIAQEGSHRKIRVGVGYLSI